MNFRFSEGFVLTLEDLAAPVGTGKERTTRLQSELDDCRGILTVDGCRKLPEKQRTRYGLRPAGPRPTVRPF